MPVGETNYEELLAMRTLTLVRSLEHIRKEGPATLCRERSIRGVREEAHRCPLSHLVRDEMERRGWPVQSVSTTPNSIKCRNENGDTMCKIPTPHFAREFMGAFDEGAFDDLVADWEG